MKPTIANITGRHDTAAYTFVAVYGSHGTKEFTGSISAPDSKTARKEFIATIPEDIKDGIESIELVETERFTN